MMTNIIYFLIIWLAIYISVYTIVDRICKCIENDRDEYQLMVKTADTLKAEIQAYLDQFKQ